VNEEVRARLGLSRQKKKKKIQQKFKWYSKSSMVIYTFSQHFAYL